LPISLAGTINQATSERHFWVHLKRFGKGPNAVCSMVYHSALSVKTSSHRAAKANRLLLQVDNAASENKNRWVLALVALFIE
jgi:hypothetical protein